MTFRPLHHALLSFAIGSLSAAEPDGRMDSVALFDPVAWDARLTTAAKSAPPALATALDQASQVLTRLAASPCLPPGQRAGISLEGYSKNPHPAPERFENFEEAARRILARNSTPKHAPDQTARWLEETAELILSAVAAAERTPAVAPAASFRKTLADLKIIAQLARFHARRSIAAVRYNLFKRGLQLAELVAATYQSREVVAAWRELVTVAAPHHPALAARWREDLVRLEHDLKDLEAQCCPPDEAVLREKIWEPATARVGR